MGIFNDTIQGFKNYFEMDESSYEDYEAAPEMEPVVEKPAMRVATPKPSVAPVEPLRRSKKPAVEAKGEQLHQLNSRQQELANHEGRRETRTTIDIKFPKRYEDAPEIVNLLLENASVLIDFQYMADNQARRFLDYLDGASSVLAGSMKKVSSSMWLLTPVNVTVNIEELRSVHGSGTAESSQYDYDMRR